MIAGRGTDARAARELILDREGHGAIATAPSGRSLLMASAASARLADALEDVAAELDRRDGTRTAVEDVRPLPADDPRGAGLTTGSLPLVLGGWLAGVVLLLLVRGPSRRLVGAFSSRSSAG